MEIRLANKLLWKKLFEGAARPSLAVERKRNKNNKSKSLLIDSQLIAASPGLKFSFRLAVIVLCSSGIWTDARAERVSISDAISQAVLTNPNIGEASANRRATETELRQTQSTLLPQVRLDARVGPERFTQEITPPPLGNGQWLSGKSGSVVVRQILFDGLASIHEIWRQAARVNAASFRVRERSELIALDAAEAYIDVVRFLRLVALADQKPIKLPPFLIWPATFAGLPHPGPDPIYVNSWPNAAELGNQPPAATFEQRWSNNVTPSITLEKEWLALNAVAGQGLPANTEPATSATRQQVSEFAALVSPEPLELHPGFPQN